MPYSTVAENGQTTLPDEVVEALHLKPGDRLTYDIVGDDVAIRVYKSVRSLRGSLTSDKGKGIPFDQIRKAAAKKHAAAQRHPTRKTSAARR